MDSSKSVSELTINRPLVLAAFGNGLYRSNDYESRVQITHDLYVPEKSVLKPQYLPRTTKDNIIGFLSELFQNNNFDKNHMITMSRIAQDHYMRHQDGRALLTPLDALLNVGKDTYDNENALQVSELVKPLIYTVVKDYTRQGKKLNRIAEIVFNTASPHEDDLQLQSEVLQHFKQSVTEVASNIKTYSPFSVGEKSTETVRNLLQEYKNAKNDAVHKSARQQGFIEQSIDALNPFRHGRYTKIN